MSCEGEIELFYAVIERAVLDASGNISATQKKSRAKIIQEARKWLFGWFSVEEETPMSFPWLCLQLDLNARDIQKQIERFLSQNLLCKPSSIRNFKRFLSDGTGAEMEIAYTTIKERVLSKKKSRSY